MIGDLFDVLCDISGGEEGEEEVLGEAGGLSWKTVRGALQWLYSKGLVSFDSAAGEGGELRHLFIHIYTCCKFLHNLLHMNISIFVYIYRGWR
jgi:hypothetical protein